MKYIGRLLCLVALLAGGAQTSGANTWQSQANSALNNLAPLTWQNRVILIWSNDGQALSQTMEQNRWELDDRDLVWFIFNDQQQLTTNYKGKIAPTFAQNMAKRYSRYDKEVLLIGKDGGVKKRNTKLYLDVLFREIDAMPMRKREMREKAMTQ